MISRRPAGWPSSPSARFAQVVASGPSLELRKQRIVTSPVQPPGKLAAFDVLHDVLTTRRSANLPPLSTDRREIEKGE